MAYNAVAQVDLELASDSSDSGLSRRPSPPQDGHAFRPLQPDTHHHNEEIHLESARTTDSPGVWRLGSTIRSMTSTSYDLVEDDDYTADPSPDERSCSLAPIPRLDTSIVLHSSSPEPPLRSTSSDVPVPLSHPTPGLQSLQGAYIGNIERLEKSAEQLSSSSADIESEIRKMDKEQKRRSCSSTSNSLIARNGGFSPAETFSSPHGSILSAAPRCSASGSHLPDVSEPAHGEDENVVNQFSVAVVGVPRQQQPAHASAGAFDYDHYDLQGHLREIVRPSTAASNDTYQQAPALFTDFDGVHFAPLERADSVPRVSLNKPPLASKPEAYKYPQTGEQMVYYPAPVPRMLNLPPKLSLKANADRQKRRTQLLDSIPTENRKSAPWSGDSNQQKPSENQDQKRQSTIPPKARASVFFEQPSVSLDVEVKQDSAVATLDSILDASALAPVSAFTDHPIAGHVGSYVYGKARRKVQPQDTRDSRKTMGQRQSTIGELDHSHDRSRRPETNLNERYEDFEEQEYERPHGDESEGDEHSSESEDDEDDEEVEEEEEEEEEEYDYVGPPNTLLAELELRKQELKQRRRTALQFPSQATHTTLLQLDEMAQKQSEKRRRRPVTLAWEGRDTADDDDVPLALLYPDKAISDEEQRPLGLMEMRQCEENEPLSARRARLLGEAMPQAQTRPATVCTTEVPGPAAESEDEGETLAERLRRLKNQNPAESEFASELLAELNIPIDSGSKDDEAVEEANENETLAQRRSRLQKEAGDQRQGKDTRNLRMRHSVAALPHGRPGPVARKSSHSTLPHPGLMGGQQQPQQQPDYGNRISMPQQVPPNMGYPTMPSTYQPAQQYGYNMGYPNPNPYFYNYAAMMGIDTRQAIIDPVQRDVIDRWRQSIR